MSDIYRLPLVLDPQSDSGWAMTCPILPELVAETVTLDGIKVKVSVHDTLEALVEGYHDIGLPFPAVLRPRWRNRYPK